jgi:hypothetical protein
MSATEKLRDPLSLVVQTGAALAIALYGIGFLVVSLHHSWYGITVSELLRPKMLSAGILFAVLFALASLENSREMGLFGFRQQPPIHEGMEKNIKVLLSSLMITGLNFVIGIVAVNVILCPALMEVSNRRQWYKWLIVILGATAAAKIPARKWFRRWPVTCGTLALAALITDGYAITRLDNLGLVLLMLFYCLVGLLTHFLTPVITERGKLRHLNWYFWLANSITLLTMYSLLIYPRVKSSLGGGAPNPIAVQFFDKSPLDGAPLDHIWLIDETAAGFYVLLAKDEKKAVFIPRSIVSAVYFNDSSTQSK